MNFEELVLKNDVDKAENELIKIKGCLDLIPMYLDEEEVDNARKVANKMLMSFNKLNQMAKKKNHLSALNIGFLGGEFNVHRNENKLHD